MEDSFQLALKIYKCRGCHTRVTCDKEPQACKVCGSDVWAFEGYARNSRNRPSLYR